MIRYPLFLFLSPQPFQHYSIEQSSNNPLCLEAWYEPINHQFCTVHLPSFTTGVNIVNQKSVKRIPKIGSSFYCCRLSIRQITQKNDVIIDHSSNVFPFTSPQSYTLGRCIPSSENGLSNPHIVMTTSILLLIEFSFVTPCFSE